MRKIKDHPLWIGHAGDMRDLKNIHQNGVEAVVELAFEEPFVELCRDLIRLRFPLSDHGDHQDEILKLAVHSVIQLLLAAIPTLVCCSNGMNRSVCITATALAIMEKVPLHVTFHEVIEDKPVVVSPRLFESCLKLL